VRVYPASHYVNAGRAARPRDGDDPGGAGRAPAFLKTRNRLLEAQRLEQRTLFDLEMLRELGYCHGIENYSRTSPGAARRAAAGPLEYCRPTPS